MYSYLTIRAELLTLKQNTTKPTSTKKVLPNTGAEVNMLGVIMADITSALGAIDLKRKHD